MINNYRIGRKLTQEEKQKWMDKLRPLASYYLIGEKNWHICDQGMNLYCAGAHLMNIVRCSYGWDNLNDLIGAEEAQKLIYFSGRGGKSGAEIAEWIDKNIEGVG